MNLHDLRAAAQRLPCSDCKAQPGDPCLNLGTGRPLEARPAHERRLWDAEARGLITLPTGQHCADGTDPWHHHTEETR